MEIKPLEGCINSDGSPYSITLKKGRVNKLLVNFLGGGMSWNEETAARPMTMSRLLANKEAFYVRRIPNLQMRFIHVGLLNAKDKRNPFRDWSILNIPYTTADFHIGNSDFPYGDGKILHHHGERNVAAVMDVLREFSPKTPDAILISGQSAGAFGCVAHCPAIARLFPDCRNIAVYSDGSHLTSSFWSKVTREAWNVREDLRGYITSSDLIVDLFRYAQDNMPQRTRFLHSNSLWDGILAKFMHKMNHGKQEINAASLAKYNETLLTAVRALKTEIRNYSYYLTGYGKKKDGSTPHVFFGTPEYLYEKMQDGVSLTEWLCGAFEKKPMEDVGKFL